MQGTHRLGSWTSPGQPGAWVQLLRKLDQLGLCTVSPGDGRLWAMTVLMLSSCVVVMGTWEQPSGGERSGLLSVWLDVSPLSWGLGLHSLPCRSLEHKQKLSQEMSSCSCRHEGERLSLHSQRVALEVLSLGRLEAQPGQPWKLLRPKQQERSSVPTISRARGRQRPNNRN